MTPSAVTRRRGRSRAVSLSASYTISGDVTSNRYPNLVITVPWCCSISLACSVVSISRAIKLMNAADGVLCGAREGMAPQLRQDFKVGVGT
jgi:hypothetical protein